MNQTVDLEFLSARAKDLVNDQAIVMRQYQTNGSTIITLIAIFLPIYLSGLKDEAQNVVFFAIFPAMSFLLAIAILIIGVLKTRPIFIGQNFDTFQALIDRNDYRDVLLSDIGANKAAYELNIMFIKRRKLCYDCSIIFTLLGIVTSVFIVIVTPFLTQMVPTEPKNINIYHEKSKR